jgi:acyl dehydratase
MTTDTYNFKTVHQFIGSELGISDWFTVDQERINQFADCTNDQQWIHIDVERAKKESLYGTTIAHGYLVLSLLPHFQFSMGVIPPNVSQAINYGLDKVRFLAPVKAGKRIRSRIVLLSVEDKGKGLLLKTQNTVEIEGEDKPAMISETLIFLVEN